tara:strand:- start:1722 stop:3701 length:1980 start_codon:yes stop_codon:yes gene_type:complete
MADQPGFWSAENFPYMPLLALGQAIPKGYQYQSQMTPYKRDARGDWGRAVNESIDQFFAMYPQWEQQKRAYALQKEQLARQRVLDAHQAKLRPFELKQAQANQELLEQKMKMREDYPEQVKSLPIDDKMKSFLLTQSPEEGTAIIRTLVTQGLKPKTKILQANDPNNPFGVPGNLEPSGKFTPIKVPVKLITLPADDPRNPYNVPVQYNPQTNTISDIDVNQKVTTLPVGHKDNPYNVPLEFDPNKNSFSFPLEKPHAVVTAIPDDDPRKADYPEALQKYLQYNPKTKEISFPSTFTREMQKLALKEGRPSATQRFKKWIQVPGNEIQSFADMERWAGTSMESKYWFATQNLPANHPLHIDAQNQLNLKHIKSSPRGFIISKGYKDPKNPKAFQRLPEPTIQEIKTGDTVSGLAKKYGTTQSQIIASNPDWFDKDMNGKANVLSMKTSAQMGGAKMTIPTGKSELTQGQIREAHSSYRRSGLIDMPYGTIIPIQTATVGDSLKLNTERMDMLNIQKSVKDFVELMQNPKARGFGKIGDKERGELEGIRQRLINNVQVLRDYGVLSPSEIQNIERSVPAVNSIIALMTRGLGSDEYVKGAMNKLYEEAVNRERQVQALLKLSGAPEVDYERYSGGIPGLDVGEQQENIFQEQDSLEFVQD